MNRWHTLVGTDLLSGMLSSEAFEVRRGVVTVPDVQGVSAINNAGTVLETGLRAPPVPFSFNLVAVLRSRSGNATVLDDGTGVMTPLGMDVASDRVVGRSNGQDEVTGCAGAVHGFVAEA